MRAEAEGWWQTGVPGEVHDDLDDESREHGQRHTKPWNPVDQIATRELVEYEAAMVGKKVRHQPQPICLCKHSHTESVAKSVGAVVGEKKHEDPNMSRRGVRNIAEELGVELALPFVGIEVKRNGGNCGASQNARLGG